MKRHDGVSDAMLVALNTATEPKRVVTPGAGVVPRRVIRPGKRLKNWHRSNASGLPLRAYVRALATNGGDSAQIAKQWLSGKGVRS